MVTNFGSPVSGRNTGSSAKVGNYLDKENIDKGLTEREYFFNSEKSHLTKSEAIRSIDENGQNQGMKKEQDRFYSFTINPSEKELKYIGGSEEKLKTYTQEVMKNYAENFNKGVTDKDLVWFAKVEKERHYTFRDKEVQEGTRDKGERKEGEQTHVHVVVSRFAAKEHERDRTASLSPMTNHRETSKGAVKGGFQRTEFIEKNEKSFERMFQYERDLKERFQYNKADPEIKREMQQEQQREKSRNRGFEIER